VSGQEGLIEVLPAYLVALSQQCAWEQSQELQIASVVAAAELAAVVAAAVVVAVVVLCASASFPLQVEINLPSIQMVNFLQINFKFCEYGNIKTLNSLISSCIHCVILV
jgi:hypothetical protein